MEEKVDWQYQGLVSALLAHSGQWSAGWNGQEQS